MTRKDSDDPAGVPASGQAGAADRGSPSRRGVLLMLGVMAAGWLLIWIGIVECVLIFLGAPVAAGGEPFRDLWDYSWSAVLFSVVVGTPLALIFGFIGLLSLVIPP